MQCPLEIAECLTEILRTGLLRIRSLGWENQPARCAIEADHLHNLPRLLADFSPELLDYYWGTERTCFIEQSSAEDIQGFEAAWNTLGEQLMMASHGRNKA